MNDDPEDNLDTLLKRHLSRELDPHLGKATVKLDAVLREAPAGRLWFGLRYSAAAMVLIGVGAAGSLVFRQFRSPTSTIDPTIVTVPTPRMPTADTVVTSWTETYDNGTVLVDPHTPARLFQRVQYEETKWKDEDGQWQSKVTIPQRDMILVDLVKQ